MTLTQEEYNLLKLYAKDQLVKGLGYVLLQFDIETWDHLIYAKLDELTGGITPRRMQRIKDIYI